MNKKHSFDLVVSASGEEVKVIASDNRIIRQFFPNNWLRILKREREKVPVTYQTSLDLHINYAPFEAVGPFRTTLKKAGIILSDRNESFPLKNGIIVWKRTHPEMILKTDDPDLDQYIERMGGMLEKKEEGFSTWLLLNDFVSFSSSKITPSSLDGSDLDSLIEKALGLSV